MFSNDWKKEVFTIPNMLSLFRLFLIPVYTGIYLNARSQGAYFLAGSILAVSCMTDIVDGQIARHFHMTSNLGRLLDPLADKLTQLTLTVCLSIKYPVLRAVLIIFIIKELFQTFVTFVMFTRGKALPGALIEGKICTTILFISLTMLVLMPSLPESIVNTIAITDVFFLAYSFISYAFAFFGKNTKLKDIDE
jgi:cardiolipin synthase